MKEYKVDLALWYIEMENLPDSHVFRGHHHSYQRTSPVMNGVPAANGIVHLVIGMAGYDLTKLPDQKLPFVDVAMEHW